MNVPSVCVTKDYFKYKQHVKFSRNNMYLRDLFKCQYCGEVYDYEELTIDHVIPKSKGGLTTWGNTVTSCKNCNQKKGDSLIAPLTKPYAPDYRSLVHKWKQVKFTVQNADWNQYLGLDQKAA